MRLDYNPKLKDHDGLDDIAPASHHPPGEHYRILINSQAIAGSSTYELRQTLTYAGHKTIRAILRAAVQTDIQGHTGVFCVGSDSVQESAAVGIQPYGGGGYPTTYMGGYSRIHGDSYLSPAIFGNGIRLDDCYVDDDEAVFVFRNILGTSQNLVVYGAVHVK